MVISIFKTTVTMADLTHFLNKKNVEFLEVFIKYFS